MKKSTFGKLLLMGALAGSFVVMPLFADYNKGYKYYQKHIKRTIHLTGTQFLKVFGINKPEDVDNLLKNDAKPLIKELNSISQDLNHSLSIS
jgi:hypothetical protein